MDNNFQGLTRTSSFTDLTSARKLIFQQVTTSDGLVRQYSCEQIFDKNSNVRQVKVSTLVTANGKPQSQEIWRSKFPRVDFWGKNSTLLTKSSSVNKIPMKIKTEKSEPCQLPALNLNLLQISDDSLKHKCREKSLQVKNHRRSHSSYDYRRSIDSSPLRLKPDLDKEADKNSELKVQGNPKIKEEDADIKRLRPLAQEFTAVRSNKSVKLLFFGLVALSVAIISSLITEIYEQSFDFRNASEELSKKIYGQDLAVAQLSEYFQQKSIDFDVVALVGGTGVGKSYAVKIIKSHFPHTYNIYEYIPPLADSIPEAYKILSALHSNLVILENLKLQDLEDFVFFVKYFYEQKNRPKVIIFAVINPQTVDDNLQKSVDLEKSIKNIKGAFLNFNIPIQTIPFPALTSEVLEDCIREEARKLNVKLSDLQVEEVKKSIVNSQSGCKGAYAKIQLYVK